MKRAVGKLNVWTLAVLIAVLVSTVSVVSAFSIGDFVKITPPTSKEPVREPVSWRGWSCAKEGETPGLFGCCKGLVAKPAAEVDSNGKCIFYWHLVCLKCGDGICGKGENKCNCPQDCTEKCIGEGEIVRDINGKKGECCPGLHEISSGYYDGIYYCTSEVCGNGICRAKENKYNCPQDCTEKTCMDSDGGKNIFVKGIVRNRTTQKIDQCTYCTGLLPSPVTCGAVVEYYCNGSGIASEVIPCPKGTTCVNGACIRKPERPKECYSNSDCAESQFCEFRTGTCKGPGICVNKPEVCIQVYAPVCGCDGKTYSNDCVRKRAGVSKRHNGVCKEEPPFPLRCMDSDGGKNIFVKGIVRNRTTLKIDQCTYCTGLLPSPVTCGAVVEYYCNGSGIASEVIPCPKGTTCVNGACIRKPESDCMPVCKAAGTRSEGWYDSCTGKLIKYDNCFCVARCKYMGTNREGWYSSCTGKLIRYAKCSKYIKTVVRKI